MKFKVGDFITYDYLENDYANYVEEIILSNDKEHYYRVKTVQTNGKGQNPIGFTHLISHQRHDIIYATQYMILNQFNVDLKKLLE